MAETLRAQTRDLLQKNAGLMPPRIPHAVIKMRSDTVENWEIRNPILASGEFGLEKGTLLIKVGNGTSHWNDLAYINKLDETYLVHLEDGTITFSETFLEKVQSIIDTMSAPLIITNDPVAATDPANKRYVDAAIAAAGHIKRKIVYELPSIEEADEDTIYMLISGDKYDEYMLVDDKFDRIGAADFNLAPGTESTLGGVLSSNADNHISITQQGFMTLNRVSTSLLFVPDGDDLVINGGNA